MSSLLGWTPHESAVAKQQAGLLPITLLESPEDDADRERRRMSSHRDSYVGGVDPMLTAAP
jgi:hypothetical protein